jgi:Domain of unknown function (DUF4129)
VTWRRLVPLALAVTALIAVVAIAAHGRPLGSGGGTRGGLPLTFWDYLFTTFVIFVVLLMILGIAALLLFRRERVELASYNRRTARALAFLLGISLAVVLIGRHVNLQHLLHPNGSPPSRTATNPKGTGKNGRHRAPTESRHVQFRWEELVVVLGLLGVLAVATRERLAPKPRRGAPEVLAAALDESLDDLRSDPDLRRAIVAAYARMETALAAAGVPRHNAEAPLEYVERALLTLDTSASAVRRLTDLFEWARFSHHEPEQWMRDEAVDALIAVRDELRDSERAAA